MNVCESLPVRAPAKPVDGVWSGGVRGRSFYVSPSLRSWWASPCNAMCILERASAYPVPESSPIWKWTYSRGVCVCSDNSDDLRAVVLKLGCTVE